MEKEIISILEAYRQWISQLEIPVILMLGIVIIAGRLSVMLFDKIRLPSIVGLLICGIFLGSSGLNVLSTEYLPQLSFVSSLALAFVAFSLGLEFKAETIRQLGFGISILIILECTLTFFLIGAGAWLLSGNLAFGIAVGAVGAASAPTAPLAIAGEFKAKGPLTSSIFAITGFDDAVSIVIFSFASTLAVSLYANSTGHHIAESSSIWYELLVEPLLEIGFAVLIGIILGYLYRLLTRKIFDGHILLLLAVSIIFIAIGLSFVFHYSLILCNMVMGVVIINRINSAQEIKLLHNLEAVMPIIFVLFFVYAGSQLDIRQIPSIGIAGLVYIVCRVCGKWLGTSLGARIAGLSPYVQKYAWAGLLSQVGVGLGLAIILIEKFRPLGSAAVAMGQQILVIVTATSLVFEVAAPILTKWALLQAGEIHLGADGKALSDDNDGDDEES